MKSPIANWSCPPRGRQKINTNGVFDCRTRKGGVGVVVRYENGDYIGAISLHIPFLFFMWELAIALCSAPELVGRRQWSAMDIECDCAALVATVERCEEDLSEIGRIVEDYKAYLVWIPSITIRHIFR